MRSLTTLTRPPMAPDPYSRAAGPRRISIWRAVGPSIVTPWSFDRPDTSDTSMPFCRILTREPSRPRMMGREAPAPKAEADTPSSWDRVSPREAPILLLSSSPDKTLAGARIWAPSLAPKGVAVTVTVGNATSCCGTGGVVTGTGDAVWAKEVEARTDKTALANKVR